MKPTIELDLTRNLRPADSARFGAHGDLPAPEGEIDPKSGLRFPLTKGGFMMASGDVIYDGAGTIEVAFIPALNNPSGALVQAWGQYAPVIALTGEGVSVNVYGAGFNVLADIEADKECRIQFDWHHQCGFTLTIKLQGKPSQTLRRRHSWKAYGQRFVPFSIFGMATDRRYVNWSSSFRGWLKSLVVWPKPISVPGPAQIDVSGERIRPPLKASADVKVLELADPPILPNPLGLVSLPLRSLTDLRKTREVAELDSVVTHCKNEIEMFTMLTWYIGALWPHCEYWPWPSNETRWPFWKRGHELLPMIKAGESGGMCGGYAHMMEEVFWSFGFDARRINVSHHSSFEAFSNEHGRWIICDASHNADCYLLADLKGNFLGCADIIRRFEAAEHNPWALMDVRQMRCREENLEPVPITNPRPGNSFYSTPKVHFYDRLHVCIDKTHQLGKDKSVGLSSQSAEYHRKCERELFRTRKPPEGEYEPVIVENLDDLTPSRNRVRTKLEWSKPGNTLKVSAEPVGVTFFDTLLISIDEDEEKPMRSGFLWKLHPGVNTLLVRTRNKLGALGYPYKIRLWKKP